MIEVVKRTSIVATSRFRTGFQCRLPAWGFRAEYQKKPDWRGAQIFCRGDTGRAQNWSATPKRI